MINSFKGFVAISIGFALCINAKSLTFNLQTKTFDLEKLNLHKDWRIYSGFKENNGNFIIKLGRPSCNMESESSHINNIKETSYTYYGVKYDFEELTFDASLDYVSKTSKSFPNTISTLNYEPVLGKRFFPFNTLGLLKRALTQDYIGKKIVFPVVDLTGFKVGLYQIIGKVAGPASGFMGATNYYSCGENLWLDKLESKKPKENKGERWFPVTNYPTPGGGIIIFSTSGVVPESDNAVFIAKLYDAESLDETARAELSFDFKCVVHVLPLEQNDGTRDFVVIAQADDGKASLGKKVMEATHGELLVLDGKTLKLKNRSGFKMEYSRWFQENVVVNDKGNIFIYGTCSDGTKEYPGKQGILRINQFMLSPNSFNLPKDQPNFQLLMADPNGNVKYVKGVNSKEAKSIAKVILGTAKKAKNDVILNTYDFNKEHFFTDKYLILAGQQYIGTKKSGVDKGNLFVALFDLATGKLTHYFIKPEDTYSTFDIIFNKDRSQLYWAAYDLESLNDIENEHGAMKAKKIKSMIAGNLHLAKIDLNSDTATNFEWLGKEQWAVNFSAPVVVKDDNASEIIFQGRTLNKKAKDSELVFIKVSK